MGTAKMSVAPERRTVLPFRRPKKLTLSPDAALVKENLRGLSTEEFDRAYRCLTVLNSKGMDEDRLNRAIDEINQKGI